MRDFPKQRVSPLRLLKFRILQNLPGEKGMYYATKFRWENWQETDAQFNAAQIATKGKVAIDLGANVGEFCEILAATASKVFAFEPDPWTVEKLRENVSGYDNVEIIAAAAGAEAGKAQLFRHVDYADNPETMSQSSSVVSGFQHIDSQGEHFEVDVVNILAFIEDNDLSVGILKIDIEGAELPLLEALFESPVLSRIDYIFCETHEQHLVELRPRFAALRKKAKRIKRPIINLDWL